jgi:hypothetical protein
MLIRVHEESFVLFFFNSFILLDKKPLMVALSFFLFVLFGVFYMSTKLLKENPAMALKF